MGILRDLGGWHFLIILAIVLLIFGATRLPALARSLGQSAKILKTEFRGDESSGAETKAQAASTVPAPPVQVPAAEPQLNTTSAQPVGDSSPSAEQR